MDLDGSLVPPWMLMKRGSPNMALASFMEHALLIRLFLLYAIARLVKVGKLQYTMHEVPVCLHQCRLGPLVPWSSYVRPSTSTEGDARPQCAIYWPPRRDSRRGFAQDRGSDLSDWSQWLSTFDDCSIELSLPTAWRKNSFIHLKKFPGNARSNCLKPWMWVEPT